MLKMASGHIVISPNDFLQPATLLQPHQLLLTLCSPRLPDHARFNNSFPNLYHFTWRSKNFGAEIFPQPATAGTPFTQSCFCRSSLFTQPALFPQVICLQKKGQQKKGLSSDSSTL